MLAGHCFGACSLIGWGGRVTEVVVGFLISCSTSLCREKGCSVVTWVGKWDLISAAS